MGLTFLVSSGPSNECHFCPGPKRNLCHRRVWKLNSCLESLSENDGKGGYYIFFWKREREIYIYIYTTYTVQGYYCYIYTHYFLNIYNSFNVFQGNNTYTRWPKSDLYYPGLLKANNNPKKAAQTYQVHIPSNILDHRRSLTHPKF